jgi:sugar O-acyltransferase (sialic acid O-acetyltransferase NeuD family)
VPSVSVRRVQVAGVDLIIVGAGGHGREVLDVVEASVDAAHGAYRFIGFVDDGDVDGSILARRSVRVIGTTSVLSTLDAAYLVGIGSPQHRRRVDALATVSGRTAASVVHPFTVIGSDTEWEDGFVMCAAATITTNIRFGRHCHVNRNATIGHDCRIGSFVTINPGANISGNVTLGDGVTVGTGASIIQGVTVGSGTVIGAGAVVTRDLAGGVVAVGVPAKELPDRSVPTR